VIPGNQKHHEQIAADRQEQKRIIRDRKEEETEDTVLKKKCEQMADRWAHLLFNLRR
jgi:hypothetical protein